MAEAVKVIVRCRPMNTREKDLNCKEVIKIDTAIGQCAITNPGDAKAPPKTFTFDGAYGTDSTTEQIYADIGYPLVEGVTEGYNGTIFAYGQTGCGKSFSMQGILDPATQRGIIPRAFDHIFETIQVSECSKYLVHASYLEIYNEEIRDLLGKDVKQKLELKEHPEKGVYVQSLSMHPCKNVVDCQKVMDRGWKNRATGATLMNADSSRSHSIFSIHLERCEQDENGEDHIRAAKLNLVDLAGSERQAKTGATGDRLKEATKINLSLSALGNVISALVDGKSKHIPYRDSKLTRLLQDSLGGNTKTLMVACLSPADNNYDETLSTLRYANRAKNIKNKPKINEDPKDALLREYQEEIEKLKAMLRGEIPTDLQGLGSGGAAPAVHKAKPHTKVVEKVEHDPEAIEREKARLREEYEHDMERMRQDYEEMKMSKEKLQEEMSRLQDHYQQEIAYVDSQSNILSPGQQNGQHSNQQVATPLVAVVRGTVAVPMATTQAQVHPVPQQMVGPDGDPIMQDVAGYPGDHEGYYGDPESVVPSDMGLVYPDRMVGEELLEDGEVDQAALEAEDLQYTQTPAQRQAVHVKTTQGAMAPRSSPTFPHTSGQLLPEEALRRESVINTEDDAMQRLKELQQAMVGGEQANNEAVKERRRKKKKYAEEHKKKLQEALAKMDGEDIMLGIYDNVQEELKVKSKLLNKEKEKSESLRQEILDLQSEFEFDRIDYLDTIRKQERELKWLQSVVDKIHPCLRRDCNYVNLDRVKAQSSWDEVEQRWNLPKMTIEKSKLPPAGGRQEPSYRQNGEVTASVYDDLRSEDRYIAKLNQSTEQEIANNYFKSKRTEKLLNDRNGRDFSKTGGKKSPGTNGYMMNGSSSGSPSNSAVSTAWQSDPLTEDQLRAAKVHGQMSHDDVPRKPVRLESLAMAGPKSGKRRKNKQLSSMDNY